MVGRVVLATQVVLASFAAAVPAIRVAAWSVSAVWLAERAPSIGFRPTTADCLDRTDVRTNRVGAGPGEWVRSSCGPLPRRLPEGKRAMTARLATSYYVR